MDKNYYKLIKNELQLNEGIGSALGGVAKAFGRGSLAVGKGLGRGVLGLGLSSIPFALSTGLLGYGINSLGGLDLSSLMSGGDYGAATKPRMNLSAARSLASGSEGDMDAYIEELQNSGLNASQRSGAIQRTRSMAHNIARKRAEKIKPYALSDKTEAGRAYLAARKAYEDAKAGKKITITDPSQMTPDEKAAAMAAAGDDSSKASVTRPLTPQELRKMREAEKAARKAALDQEISVGELEDAGIFLDSVSYKNKILSLLMEKEEEENSSQAPGGALTPANWELIHQMGVQIIMMMRKKKDNGWKKKPLKQKKEEEVLQFLMEEQLPGETN